MTEEHRSLSNFTSLLDKFEEWAKIFKVKRIISGDMGINIERSRRLYGNLGWTEYLLSIKELGE